MFRKLYPKYETHIQFEKRTAEELKHVTLSTRGLQELSKLDCVTNCITDTYKPVGPVGKLLIDIIAGNAKLHFPKPSLAFFSETLEINLRVYALIYSKEGKELIVCASSVHGQAPGKKYTTSHLEYADGVKKKGAEYKLGQDFGKFIIEAKYKLYDGYRLSSPLDKDLL